MAVLDVQFHDGVDAVNGYGDRWLFLFEDTWAVGDTWLVEGVLDSGLDFVLGRGKMSLITTLYSIYAYKNRLYAAGGARFYFSGYDDQERTVLPDPSGWEIQTIGAGDVLFSQQSFGATDTCYAFGTLQGRLIAFGRNGPQLWLDNADPDQFELVHALPNVGLVAPASVQALGDADDLFLSDTGIRSLKALALTSNAYVDDVGSPIDTMILESMRGGSADNDAAVSVVDLDTRNYWLFLNGTIYVLAQFPSSQIAAWSTYTPTSWITTVAYGETNFDQAGNSTYTGLDNAKYYKWTPGAGEGPVAGWYLPDNGEIVVTGTPGAAVTGTLLTEGTFTPVKFVQKSQQIWVLDSSKRIYVYGSTSGTKYDHTTVTVETQWLDSGRPDLVKQSVAADMSFFGTWSMWATLNYKVDPLVYSLIASAITSPTYTPLTFPLSGVGTHIKFKMTTNALADASDNPPVFSALVYNFDDGGEKR